MVLAAAAAASVLALGSARLPENVAPPRARARRGPDAPRLGQAFVDQRAAHPGESGFRLLGNGLDAFVARAVLARLAERSIDVQYFLYQNDLVGRLFTFLLLEAADRGVRVRLLVDDMDLAGRDLGVAAMDAHPNVEVRLFNPFSRGRSRILQLLTRMGTVSRRMHAKSFTVDNQFTIVGGRNIADEYFRADPEVAFTDLDVMGAGPVARKVSSVFDLYWNSELAYPASELLEVRPTPRDVEALRARLAEIVASRESSVYLTRLRDSDLARAIRSHSLDLRWGRAEVVFDRPEKIRHGFEETRYHLRPMLEPTVKGIEQELVIFSPYFVPGASGTAFLTGLASRGIGVKVLTNSLASNDVKVVHVGYAKYRRELLRGGVELYELNDEMTREQQRTSGGASASTKAALHAKTYVFDRKSVFIGSMNLDPRAMLQNVEIGIVVHVAAIAEDIVRWFEAKVPTIAFQVKLERGPLGYEELRWYGREQGRRVIYSDEPHAGFWRRFGICARRGWPFESQL
jgi:putative cardiolipin synthase